MNLTVDSLNTHLTVRSIQVSSSQQYAFLCDISNLCLILFDNGSSQFQLRLLPGNDLKQIAVPNYFALYFVTESRAMRAIG
jgi:hypothetical protein